MLKNYTAGIILLITLTMTAHASNSSALGLDYEKITKNKILTEVMLEIEPKLIEHYKSTKYGHLKKFVLRGVEHVASNFSRDYVNETTVENLRRIAPEAPLKFLKLDKMEFPNLWNFGELERLRKVEAESLKLYKALHGKDYEGKL